jgi:hypothetical protein
MVFAGCVRTSARLGPTLPGSCRSESVRWFAPDNVQHRTRLDAWCAGVGSPIIQSSGASSSGGSVSLSDVTFVSWNVHVGNGDVRALVDDLHAGVLTGHRKVSHFVLLLQEALRADGVPSYSRHAAGARRIAARDPSRADILQISRDLDLSLIYVPSMRNGNARDPASDRGSAILSTLPLSEPVAIELPGERQRRVVILARLQPLPGDAGGTSASVGVIHLDALGTSRRLWVFWTPWMRERQVKSLEPMLPEGALVLGADLNTWHGTDEAAVRLLGRHFRNTPVSRERVGLGLRVLDYLFMRAGDVRGARYRQLQNRYGSDHRPIVGWFE